MRIKRINDAKRLVGVGLTALILVASLATRSQAVLIDPDGTLGANGAINVGSLDWTPTSFLAVGGTSAIQSGPGSTFDVLLSAQLGNFLSPTNNVIANTGLNTNYEWTMVARLTERVEATGPGSASFRPVSVDYVEMYFDTAQNASALVGSGFNDGRLILRATSLGAAPLGSFLIDGQAGVVALDQSGSNDYDGQLTVQGSGSQGNISTDAITADGSFFLQQLAQFGVLFANISTGLPFISVDPATCFTLNASGVNVGAVNAPSSCSNVIHIDGTYAQNAAGNPFPLNGYIPITGLINGFTEQGPDFVAQTDFNSPLVAAVPEPANFLLFGIGLLTMGGYLRARSRKAK
ncbi:MAG TPA: PEP-CTERM sorting domain-containing protein [Candidatus Udaeobacter sp.]|nr:PEP-CTERM sorting domain-containing protein [Candidatus Udaeobacter sp.]